MLDLKAILEPYGRELRRVEDVITSKLTSDAARLTEISRYLANLGGKKVRPLLACALARGLGLDLGKESPSTEQLFTIAAGVEMIHMATLLHDDIIDRSMVRRHQPSAYAKYGLDDTLLTGDFLLVRAFGLCSQLEQPLVAATEQACVALTEGEILEKRLSRDTAHLGHAITIAEKKTAALFELASFSAAFLAQLDEASLVSAREFGLSLGTAFQVVDDILDVMSDEKILGKPSGQDLREQKPSVINILWLDSGAPLSKRLLVETQQCDEAWVAESLKELRGSPVVTQAKGLAQKYVDKALGHLENLKQQARSRVGIVEAHFRALENLIQFALNRIH